VLFYDNFNSILVTAYLYISVYNFSLLLIFALLQQFVSFSLKTLYSFNDLKFNFFFTFTLTICLFSMAGVPPFIGFFTKLSLLVILINSNFFFLYVFYFILLFFGLYFYLQNLRFLYSTKQDFFNKITYNNQPGISVAINFYYTSYAISIFLISGLFFLDDLILYFT
jgi:NADH:ubiquinone oxidoreductase subunit 2 (subunit N)